MKEKNKILYLTQTFRKDAADPEESVNGPIESIFIEGYANTTSKDRSGDIIPMTAWNAAVQNYLKNPIILGYHDADNPIGRMVDHKIDEKGLWVKARISAAADDVFNLVKDGILTAFSVGFYIKDATYDSITDLFIIKELELLEISVVSVPCNQDSTFSLSKAFDSAEDYSNFKSQYMEKSEAAKGLESPAPSTGVITKEWNMDPKELELLLAKAAEDASAKTAAAIEEKHAKAALVAIAEKKAADDAAALDAKIAAAIQLGASGSERLLADVEKRLNDQTAASKSALEGLEAVIKEKADDLAKLQASKMNFADKGNQSDFAKAYTDRESAYLAAKIMGKGIEQLKFGQEIVQKYGAHVPSAQWELEISTVMEAEIRRRLIFAPIFRQLAMKTNVMSIPVNPEAGFATWMANSSFGSAASAGATQTHTLKEITLNAYKVATNEYMAYEEEEDAVLVLLPIIRDAMVRRVARAVDKAFILGAGSGADPVKGAAIYDATSAVNVTNTGTVTLANLRALRKDLGAWGLDPAELVYVVSTDSYYDLMEDTAFQTMNQVGPAATLLTGQIGTIGNTPVLVSDALATKTTGTTTSATNIGAVCIAPANFIAGNQRGLRFDTQELAETQRRVLVASMRTGLTQLSTVNGIGISALRWS
jgi:HK97 family phage prohead protease/HK97 family phage major capsid protein